VCTASEMGLLGVAAHPTPATASSSCTGRHRPTAAAARPVATAGRPHRAHQRDDRVSPPRWSRASHFDGGNHDGGVVRINRTRSSTSASATRHRHRDGGSPGDSTNLRAGPERAQRQVLG
jgi:hypothetical protein